MATLAQFSRSLGAVCARCSSQPIKIGRCLSTARLLNQNEKTDPPPSPPPGGIGSDKPGFLSRLLSVRTIDTGSTSHSTLLSDKDVVYELQFHSVKPEYMETYLNQFADFLEKMKEKKAGSELIGSWTVDIGEQDEAIHLWRYRGGYPVLNNARNIYRTDPDFVQYRKSRNEMLRSRKNQIMLEFSFWGEIKPRDPEHIYELRSYTLKPGTMIEWGNTWAKALQYRNYHNEAVGGFLTHIGDLHRVHHLWAYDDLQTRKQSREDAWRKPGWDECVQYTVPLVKTMQSRILIPTPFSPLK